MPNELLAALLVIETVLFALTMVLASRERTRVIGEYVGVVFHLLLLPVVAHLADPIVVQGAGLAWVVCDVVASIGLIWASPGQAETSQTAFTAVRLAGHLFAGVWIASASLPVGPVTSIVGFALALSFAAYTLAAGRLPQKALAVPGVLLAVWLLLLAWHFHAG